MVKETDKKKKERLEKMKKRIKNLEEKAKLEKELKKKEEKLRELRNPKKDTLVIPRLGIDISKIKNLSLTNQNKRPLAGVRTPISDAEKMWVVSWWENRKTLDQNFDPDNWFKSSVHMDNKERNRQIDDFWTGRAEQNTEDFWTGPTMWQRREQF